MRSSGESRVSVECADRRPVVGDRPVSKKGNYCNQLYLESNGSTRDDMKFFVGDGGGFSPTSGRKTLSKFHMGIFRVGTCL